MVTREQKEKIFALGKKYNLDFIILYGSVARNQAGKLSDLDIAVYKKGGITSEKYFELYGKMFGIFESKEVDLKTLNDQSILYRYLVVRDGILLFGNELEYLKFKTYIIRDYQDSKDLFDLAGSLVRRHQKELEERLNVKY
ncbi:hypothetical protein COT44_03415 [Candidatus Shapirobacteria bacterium CG08_land_8_20_14_0_20_39_18]|uniref:Polymerase beta nucleotidyltransferase domain-containing protein n=1 Tax=Candidatus Shapirobacteria bacterium CG08_land_8_20_14_0_20_39_18 TaxID=1974883 RepID=A0A2M6XCW8_9BACT|nr:MAG: hypothetical protein COT44_03415 [Candidatus Shapirobacteria bacterium CG08_land_8_20_14_0_20_39_18]PIY65109.1 MAG: hypothetical protein COY91_03525 [Candidatus Shapirobacteria bacterium CG_4_10_14_0_8_um_filter_39_15]PJE68293.1 MAG: hypothetical protein COU94_02590 [Candidatus Shapirobacteria bacterium CG10_big_fil_rev_8_21_14_0_10_38_8]